MSGRQQERGRIKGFRVGLCLGRKMRDWNQKRVAMEATIVARARTGDPDVRVSQSLVAMIESGEREPSWEMAGWIAEALGYSIPDLCVIDDDPSKRSLDQAA